MKEGIEEDYANRVKKEETELIVVLAQKSRHG